MTAEIAIMNKSAIALAADSAVTFGDQKIYNSVNKLFMLSKFCPVGLMIYGNAELMGVPWETIVKIYRDSLGKNKFDTLKEYAEDFIKFIKKNNQIFPNDVQSEIIHSTVYNFTYHGIVRGIEDKIDTFVEENGEISEKEILNIIKESIDAVYSFWSKAKKLKHIPKDHDRLIIRKHEKDFKEIIKVSFRKLPLSNKQKKQLLEVFGWIFTKELFPNSCSGVVIAGFGESEIFPALISYEFEGIFENEVKFMESDKSEKISYDNQATITPFAQSEMVYSFMEGVDPDYQEKLQEGLVNIFDVYKNEICENIIPDKDKEGEVRKKLTSVNKKILSGLGEELAKYRNQVNVGPIMKAVAALPIEELALMAESLVNLTSFKRKVSMQRETVGGPIDVAVISKGDGFIWIKRKHYFEPDKNPHFFANYYNKCDNNFNGKKDDKRKDL